RGSKVATRTAHANAAMPITGSAASPPMIPRAAPAPARTIADGAVIAFAVWRFLYRSGSRSRTPISSEYLSEVADDRVEDVDDRRRVDRRVLGGVGGFGDPLQRCLVGVGAVRDREDPDRLRGLAFVAAAQESQQAGQVVVVVVLVA